MSVDVLAYNSKVYYVIMDGGGYGQQIVRLPCTGNETVLDAIAQVNGLPQVASKPSGSHDQARKSWATHRF